MSTRPSPYARFVWRRRDERRRLALLEAKNSKPANKKENDDARIER